MEENIRCNICEVNLDSDMIEEHSSDCSHISNKSELEKTIETTRKNSLCRHDNDSVVSQWQKSNYN